jgi:uncharacterized protein YndB with AHSA1/START domain
MTRKPTGRVERSARGTDLIITRSFRAEIEEVWESVTASESTSRWIGSWDGEPGPGKTIRFKMLFEGGDHESAALIERCEPPHHLALSMKDAAGEWRLELRLQQRGETTELTFVQHLTPDQQPGSIGPGWEYYLDRLVAARSGEAMPEFEEYYPAQKAHYEG